MTAMPRRRVTLNDIHKWAGLAAALWLAVLAVTGMMQVNRQQWRWQWASGPAMSEAAAAGDDKYLWRFQQVNPADPSARVAAGAAGAFLTSDGGKSWHRLTFSGEPIRNVSALEPGMIRGRWTVYAGTDHGVWRLDAASRRMMAAGLQGQEVNSLSVDGDHIAAAVGMSRLFSARLSSGGDLLNWTPITLAPLPSDARAGRVDLGRLLQDIHVGRGLFGGMIDKALWNLFALGLFLLSFTGFAYWAIMRWCRRARLRPKAQRPASNTMRKAQRAIQWSFRVHAMVVGVVLALPLLLIFITGIYQDHRHDLQTAFRGIAVPDFLLPPAYRGDGWRGQVMNVALASDAAGPFLAIGNRRGMFISRDRGRSWAREGSFKGPAMRIRKIGGELYVPGRMMRRVQVRRGGIWREMPVPKPVVMANELSEGPGNTIWWTRGDTTFSTDATGEMLGKTSNRLPTLGYLPWASFAAELHEGALISRHWKWVNDLAGLLGIALVITGFLRWRKRKW